MTPRTGRHRRIPSPRTPAEGSAAWRIDSFVLSCRILGRQVERALLAALAQRAAAGGAERLIGEYVDTGRNAPARDFYAGAGLAAQGDRWVWTFTRGAIESPAHLSHEVPEGCPR